MSPPPHPAGETPHARALGRAYFAVQAAGGATWWLLVFTGERVRQATLGGLDPVLVFALDLPLFVLASPLAAAGVRWALWLATGWTVLVALLMVGYATVTGLAGWGALCMLAAGGGSVLAATLIRTGGLPSAVLFSGPFAFRTARPAGSGAHLGRTAGQIVLFWGVFLAVIPAVIAAVERRWQLAVEVPAAVRGIGLVLLVGASALGLCSAAVMSRLGAGTPLPSAMPARLVTRGPYRWVRNPMAVAGIAQGVGVGLLLGSWLVVGYAVCGSLFWHVLIRPREEQDLLERFGEPYRAYRGRVRVWLPIRRRGGASG
ncbi:isoprenylcysteine carboxylmethyltransferase family protein [Leucobacter sp. M11]|uniref:isoprenylcysteine carboxylmethyltransferase family protein n=1 Tax=Leucobacter sp. M11 TaxID=2993565 RepID=UPI002D7E8446|nr:isoprenylcysteine carboxylmethyltransferase family protein [Leucobacter sp. M11]MEB4615931.1 isoprenylcysteine carboxylmethyltransferase family protein [Leucobacter sp. M11]